MSANKRKPASAPTPAAAPPRKFPGSYLPDRSAKTATREEVLSVLSKEVAPVPENLASLLKLPEKLYISGDFFNYISISSDKETDAKDVAASLLIGQPFPEKTPDYAIYITHKGSSRFCVFIDKKRQVIAYAVLSRLMVEGTGWGGLESSLEDALRAASSGKPRDSGFSFVIRGERHPGAEI